LARLLTDPRVSKNPRQHWPRFIDGEIEGKRPHTSDLPAKPGARTDPIVDPRSAYAVQSPVRVIGDPGQPHAEVEGTTALKGLFEKFPALRLAVPITRLEPVPSLLGNGH
jgi:hypothetical protein